MDIPTQTPQINHQKLTSEQRDKLEIYHQTQTQLQTLKDIADMTQEVVNILDDQKQDKSIDHLGVLLTDIRESLSALKDKETPQTPDYAKPVVEAVAKLEKALSASIKAIDVKPVIDAPQVNVSPSSVDLKGVEKALADMPKAFEQAIKLISIPEVPKTDFQPLLDAWTGIAEQLVSIENATRMKPLPGSMTISNLSGITDPLETIAARSAYMQFDADDSAPTYIGCNADVDASDNNANWTIYKFVYSGSNVTSWKKKTGAWSQRVALFT